MKEGYKVLQMEGDAEIRRECRGFIQERKENGEGQSVRYELKE